MSGRRRSPKRWGSQTASDILQFLAENKKSLTEITDRLAIPLTTAKYHIENLLDAGLISVAETKYSVKGREIKIYSLTNQLPDRCSPHLQCAFAAAEICIIVLYRDSRHAGTIPRIALIAGTGTGMNAPSPSSIQWDRGTGVITTQAVSEGYQINATLTPGGTVAVSKGIPETAAANLTPFLSPLTTLVQSPSATLAPVPMNYGAPPGLSDTGSCPWHFSLAEYW